MLLQNKSFLTSNGLRYLAGAPAISGVLAKNLLSGQVASQPNRFIGGATFTKGDSTPSGYSPTGGAWYPNRKTAGSMGSHHQMFGEAITNNSTVYGGCSMPASIVASSVISAVWTKVFCSDMPINITAQAIITAVGGRVFQEDLFAEIIGEGTFEPTGSLLVDAFITIAGIGLMEGILVGKLDAAAEMIASGDLEGSLGALGGMVAEIIGEATISAEPYATGTMEASILSYSTLSPESLAGAVWNAVIADFQNTGSAGKALSSASAAGDPWTALLDNYTDDATFGAFVKKLLTTNKFIALK